jgi:Flp pilus assembly protein TadD
MTDAETLYFLGNRRMAAGDNAGAEACFREATRLEPDLAEAWCNLGLMLAAKNVLDEAEACYRRAIRLGPDYAEIHINLGILLARRKRFDDAEKSYRQAIALSPQSLVAWSNLGVLYACCKREPEAEQCYRHVMELDDQYRSARFNLSYLLLRQGRFDEGWACLEARDSHRHLESRFACPRWQGDALIGKSLLIGYEGGHGDMIQFCRYVPVLKSHGAARVSIICHPALKRLFATLDGADGVFAFDEHVPLTGWDYWTPPLSIPYHCKTRIDSIPAALPYLTADPVGARTWQQRLPAGGMRIGLVWKGNPDFENDADRSVPALDVFAPLGMLAGVTLVSVQKGAGEEEARNPPAQLPLVDLGGQTKDFADVAAIIANLDLLISVDTAAAHLAGAMGKPVWLMLPAYKADWRWLADRADSPWYPGVMRLFRQTRAGDWATVVTDMCAALEEWRSVPDNP